MMQMLASCYLPYSLRARIAQQSFLMFPLRVHLHVGRRLALKSQTPATTAAAPAWLAHTTIINYKSSQLAISPLASSSARAASTEAAPFRRPSVTWGVVQEYKTQLTAREEVINFLKAEGIDTREFESVELPSSVDVVRERLDFLTKLGLEKRHINEYPLMICCSVKKNMVPVLDYLEKLGLTSKMLPIFLRKYPMVLHTSVVVDLQPVVWYLEGLGIERRDMARVLLKYPDILGFRLEGTISTSVAYLVSIGVGIREIAPMLTEFPQIMGMRVGNNIKPKVEYISRLGLPKEAVAKILEKHPYLLGLGLDEKIRPAIAALIEVGVGEKALPMVIAQFPDVFTFDVKEKVTRKRGWLTKQLHIQSEDVPRVIEKLPQIIVINERMAMDRVNVLRKVGGFKENDIAKMVTGCPQILALSIDNALSPNLMFFKKEMKRPWQELTDFPSYLTYSLEDRIKPRYSMIRQRGIKCSLSWFLNCSDFKFQERLGMDYVEDPAIESEDFSFVMGGSFRPGGQFLLDGGEYSKAESDVHKLFSDDTQLMDRNADGGKAETGGYDVDIVGNGVKEASDGNIDVVANGLEEASESEEWSEDDEMAEQWSEESTESERDEIGTVHPTQREEATENDEWSELEVTEDEEDSGYEFKEDSS